MSQVEKKQKKYFLSVIPENYLLGIIDNKDFSESKLKNMLEIITNKKVIITDSALKNLTKDQLIDIFIVYEIITLKEAKELYFQFRDNKNPIFYLYKIRDKIENRISEINNDLKKEFERLILNDNYDFIPENNVDLERIKAEKLRYKDFGLINLKTLQNGNISEVNFEYLERIDYISKNYIPKFVYALKSGFFWLDKNNQLLIIKCKTTQINEAIITVLENILNTKIWGFNLSKTVIDQIFDKKEMIKSSLISSNHANPNLFDSMIIKDVKFSEKARNEKFDFILEYERRLSSYRTDIRGFSTKIKVNIAQYGKISLYANNIKINRVREWLIRILVVIMEIHHNFIESGNISSYIRSNDFIPRTSLYHNIRSNKTRKKIYEMIKKIVQLKENLNIKNVDFYFPMKLAYYFDRFLIPVPNLRCAKDECNMPLLCPNEDCESLKFEIKKDVTKRRYYLKCSKCNEEISEETILECVDNHKYNFNLDNSIDYIFHPSLKIELYRIFHNLELGYNIDNDRELYYIHQNRLYRKDQSEKLIYNWEELPAFKEIPKLDELSKQVKKAQAKNITQILEKCNNRVGMCRNCHLNEEKDEICLLKIFAKYSNGQAHPHTATEFGDFDFPQQFSYGLETLIGIAKSYGKKPTRNAKKIYATEFGLLTFKNNDRLIEQFIQLSMEDRVNFIMVVVGRVIDTGLKATLYELAKWKKKKVVIISPKHLIPIFSYYFKKLVDK